MSGRVENERIWRHFQNVGREMFDQGQPRHDFLIAEVLRIAGTKRSEVSVLNIGVGNAYIERRLKSVGFVVTGLDPDQGTIADLSSLGIEGIMASLPNTGIAAETFDIIVASEVIEHLSDEDLAPSVSEIARILKKGGAFIGTVPYNERLEDNAAYCPECGATFHRWGHQQTFDQRRMQETLAPELDMKRLQVRAFVDFSGRSLGGRIRGAVRYVAGRFGYSLAAPSLYFRSSKPRK